MRFYLVDKVLEMSPGKYVEGVKCISLSDDIFNEHFPGYPIFPGSLMIEGMAQMSGIFLEWCRKEAGYSPRRAALTLVQKMKFRDIVTPGDRLIYRADVKSLYPEEYGVVTVKALKDGKLCAEGELLFTFLEITDPKMLEISDTISAFACRDAKIVL
ncbi:MAG: beta-hydroxyacyl-ACP dehydratase [Bacteroidales bacterium]|nr:beta-hydroxyacyl-ACP dehydratase [Bacteroidales bacterium]